MDLKELNYYFQKFKFGEDNFHNLMKKKVQEILLVSTFYDAFIFEQDGRLSEQIHGEYQQLNLSTAPRITNVPTGKEAIEIMKNRDFDMIITMAKIGKTNPYILSKHIKTEYSRIPILLLLNSTEDLNEIEDEDMEFIDDVFLWKGDSKLFLAMIKSVEDRMNLKYDTDNGMVRVILLVEDSVLYYSRFLPLLYSIIMKQTQRLIAEETNEVNKRLRMRARPKVILVHDFESAEQIIANYKEYLIAVISDVKYPYKGKEDASAGFKLLKKVRQYRREIPALLQSSEISNKIRANKEDIGFLHKDSKTLLKDLRRFILKNLGFGDFIFRLSETDEISSAHSMHEFEKHLHTVPAESLIYHGARNHFSAWLTAHGEFLVAGRIKSMVVDNFETAEELRDFLINIFSEVRMLRNKGKIVNFNKHIIAEEPGIIRLSNGSLGGKGRSLAFLNALLVSLDFEKHFPDIEIGIPKTFIIGTEEYDDFLENNKIEQSVSELKDSEIKNVFLLGKLSLELCTKLEIIIGDIKYPLAIRSSGLLEDSGHQPFAGVYDTFMIPNNHPDSKMRLIQLTQAIKLIFSSVFQKNAMEYIENSGVKPEEEKMAVIIQRIAGRQYSHRFYPHMSGVAQSYNYYPTSYLKPEQGLTSLALGMGKAVVDGMKTYRFCPERPKTDILQTEELLKNSQNEFFALDLSKIEFDLTEGEIANYTKCELTDAEKDGTLKDMVSIWDSQNGRIVFDTRVQGARILNFAPILKYDKFPLSKILSQMLEVAAKAMGAPVEIEFSVDLTKGQNSKPTFYVLQIRPLSVNAKTVNLKIEETPSEDIFVKTEYAMGNGIIEGITDVIYMNHELWDNTKTVQMTREIEKLNKQTKKYILIGPGRWGTRDRFLGIPVKWHQIKNAKIIIETSLEDFVVESSQGTHFFHNLISMKAGYLLSDEKSDFDVIDWYWLKQQETVNKTKHFVHKKLKEPITAKLDGRSRSALILKHKE
jgi:hypothetical protein